MTSLSDIYLDSSDCNYIKGISTNMTYFFATDLDEEELDYVLENGIRKFGNFFFINNCSNCLRCIPIRVLVDHFIITKEWKRVIKKNSDIKIKIKELCFREEIFDIYKDHKSRFDKNDEIIDGNNYNEDIENFKESFFFKSCPSLQVEYYLGEELIAVDFLDKSNNGLNSVYFIFKTKYSKRGLGNYSVIKEIEYAKSIGLKYYYLGYYIKENPRMEYKDKFKPNEKMDWSSGLWK